VKCAVEITCNQQTFKINLGSSLFLLFSDLMLSDGENTLSW